MKNRKKLTAALLAVAMLICMIPTAVWADDNRAELPSVMTRVDSTDNDGATLGLSEEEEGDDGGISLMSLLPLHEVTGSVLLDRSDKLPTANGFDSSFTAREVFDQLIADGKITEADISGKQLIYAADNDDFREVTLDETLETGYLSLSNNFYYKNRWYSKVYFIAGDGDQFNMDNTRYEITINFIFYEVRAVDSVTISRKEQLPEGLNGQSIYAFYVKEALHDALAADGRLDANGNFNGDILYDSGKSSYSESRYYQTVTWDSVIFPSLSDINYSTYNRTAYFYASFIVAPGGNDTGAVRYNLRVNIEYAGIAFLNDVSAGIYNSNNNEVRIVREDTYYSTVYLDEGMREAYTKTLFVSKNSFEDSTNAGILLHLPEGYSTANTAVYKGLFDEESQLSAAENITSRILYTSDEQTPYAFDSINEYADYYELCLTFVVTDPNGEKNIIPVKYFVWINSNYTSLSPQDGTSVSVYLPGVDYSILYYGSYYYAYPENTASIKIEARYYDYINGNGFDYGTNHIDFACLGKYSSKEEAIAAGKTDVKGQLFNYIDGISVNLSDCEETTAYLDKELTQPITLKTIWVTVVDTYGVTEQVSCTVGIGYTKPEREEYLYGGSSLTMSGAKIDSGNRKINLNYYPVREDGYYAIDYYNGYQTMFILNSDKTPVANGTAIYPTFGNSTASTVHRADSGVQTSGETPLTFENGKAVQYTVGAENGVNRGNYWVTFVTQSQGGAKLFVNAVNNTDHWNKDRNMPQREIFFSGLKDYHDIFIANVGDEELTGISVKLSDDTTGVKLDDYWTVIENSKACLAPFTDTYEPKNIAKIRLLPADDSFGQVISGTLTISTANGGSCDIDLTGIAGIPEITTEEIPDGVKYVPYSKVIMTNCMHGNDGMSFELSSGKLPEGLELKPNGLIYGVPKEAGTFFIGVKASYDSKFTSKFGRDTTYSLGTVYYSFTIADNTDENVDGTNGDDYGFELLDRVSKEITVYYRLPNGNANEFDMYGDGELPEGAIVGDIVYDSDLFRSEGEFSDFTVFYLDGEPLDREAGDYSAESGSTKITVNDQTFSSVIGSPKDERHTLAAEFKQDGTQEIKRSAQNFTIKYVYNNSTTPVTPGGNTGNNGNGSGSSGRPGNTGSSSNTGGTAVPSVGTNSVSNEKSEKTEEGSATVNMTIVDKNGNALAGLDIELHSTPRYASTDNGGQVKFDSVEFGKHTLYITDPDTGRKRSKSFTVRSGDSVQVSGSAITAVNGGTVNLTVVFDGGNISFGDVQGEDVAAGAYAFDSSDRASANVCVPLMAVLFVITAAVLTVVRRRGRR
ncbi:MAG: hypothetical protein NC078_07405 [Ruminococcus sp.]|nr:hypothetical protein [Ruminococcus sp.]